MKVPIQVQRYLKVQMLKILVQETTFQARNNSALPGFKLLAGMLALPIMIQMHIPKIGIWPSMVIAKVIRMFKLARENVLSKVN
jgi:hypothetical protein